MEKSCISFDEKYMLCDALDSEKFMAGIYNGDVLESATPELRCCFAGILTDIYRGAEQVFDELSRRGEYPTQKAQESAILEAKQKHAPKVACV